MPQDLRFVSRFKSSLFQEAFSLEKVEGAKQHENYLNNFLVNLGEGTTLLLFKTWKTPKSTLTKSVHLVFYC